MSSEMDRLVEIMRTLRSAEGCPWDREQTLETLRPYAVEEVYEVLDAIDRGDVEDHCEELGDLLLQVVFHAQLREEEGAFAFEDVARRINEKLIRRHPHVFGDVDVADSDEVLRNWNEIKASEKAHKPEPDSVLDGVPHHLPALRKAQDLQHKAAKVGFDWPNVGLVLDKVEEEIAELKAELEAGDSGKAREELGDVLFALANVARHLGADAEQLLQDGNRKFRGRFQAMERRIRMEGRHLSDYSLAELDRFWDLAKQERS